jgi:hypothetical protein
LEDWDNNSTGAYEQEFDDTYPISFNMNYPGVIAMHLGGPPQDYSYIRLGGYENSDARHRDGKLGILGKIYWPTITNIRSHKIVAIGF